jgi:D-cysteine desulfhydrase
MLTERLSRVSLAFLPTPLEEMSRLRAALGGGPRLLVKRDDQTGLATGGNKTRKLEFLVAEALAQGADTLVTVGAIQSNHCRQTAAAAVKVGLRCALALRNEPLARDRWNGNLLLDELLGAQIHWSRASDYDAALNEVMSLVQAAGGRPYAIPVGGSIPLGAAGYAAAVEELATQLAARGERVDRIVFASSSGGTQAGLLVGVQALRLDMRVEGIYVDKVGGLRAKVLALANDTAGLLDLPLRFAPADVILHERYGEPGYAVVTEAEREALRLFGQTEGLILDPVYTGRAAAGLIDLVRRGAFDPAETVLFWHTGGVAGLFGKAAEVTGTD